MKKLRITLVIAAVITLGMSSCDDNGFNSIGKSYCEKELQLKKDNGWAPQDCECQYDRQDDNWYFDC